MKYIEWRDMFESYLRELKAENRERALAYYGEMYADMRDSGMTEEQAVDEFGAPYDAAKKIIDEEAKSGTDETSSGGRGDEPSRGNSDAEDKRVLFTSAGTVNEFEINGAPGKIYMQFFDGERVEIDYPTTPLLDYKICEKDGKIIITHGGFKFSNVSFKPKKYPLCS